MRIERLANGDFRATDELCFLVADIAEVAMAIKKSDNVNVNEWGVTLELNNNSGFWELYFMDPEASMEDFYLD